MTTGKENVQVVRVASLAIQSKSYLGCHPSRPTTDEGTWDRPNHFKRQQDNIRGRFCTENEPHFRPRLCEFGGDLHATFTPFLCLGFLLSGQFLPFNTLSLLSFAIAFFLKHDQFSALAITRTPAPATGYYQDRFLEFYRVFSLRNSKRISRSFRRSVLFARALIYLGANWERSSF